LGCPCRPDLLADQAVEARTLASDLDLAADKASSRPRRIQFPVAAACLEHEAKRPFDQLATKV
jgi:hypothetical protein